MAQLVTTPAANQWVPGLHEYLRRDYDARIIQPQ